MSIVVPTVASPGAVIGVTGLIAIMHNVKEQQVFVKMEPLGCC